MALQGELWLKSQYGVAKCLRCGSLGTIVDMGLCCRIAGMVLQDSSAAESRSGARLSTHDHDKTRTRTR